MEKRIGKNKNQAPSQLDLFNHSENLKSEELSHIPNSYGNDANHGIVVNMGSFIPKNQITQYYTVVEKLTSHLD